MFIRRTVFAVAVCLAALLGAGAAAALTFTPTVTIGRVGGTTWDMLDPAVATSTLSAPDANGVQHWQLLDGYDFVKAAYTVSAWTVDFKEDPFVTNNITLTNTSGVTSTFVATVLMPIPAFAYNAVVASSLGVTVTDSNSDGLIYFDIAPASTIYNGFVNFPASTSLLTMDPIVLGGGSFPINALTDCFPPIGTGCTAIASNGVGFLAVTPGVASLVGLTLTFQLGAGDSVGITSRFEIQNIVPEPATVALLGVGLAGLALARRRAV